MIDELQGIDCTNQDNIYSGTMSQDVSEEQPSDVPRYQPRNRLTERALDRYL